MSKPVSPCKDCERRQLGCHSTCADYIAFDRAKKEHNAKVSEARKSQSISWTKTTRKMRRGEK